MPKLNRGLSATAPNKWTMGPLQLWGMLQRSEWCQRQGEERKLSWDNCIPWRGGRRKPTYGQRARGAIYDSTITEEISTQSKKDRVLPCSRKLEPVARQKVCPLLPEISPRGKEKKRTPCSCNWLNRILKLRIDSDPVGCEAIVKKSRSLRWPLRPTQALLLAWGGLGQVKWKWGCGLALLVWCYVSLWEVAAALDAELRPEKMS